MSDSCIGEEKTGGLKLINILKNAEWVKFSSDRSQCVCAHFLSNITQLLLTLSDGKWSIRNETSV